MKCPIFVTIQPVFLSKSKAPRTIRTGGQAAGRDAVYIRWIKFFVDAVGKAAKRSAQLLLQYEAIVVKDKNHNLPQIVTHICQKAAFIKSLRGTQFRIWATSILKEYMKNGFALDDDRLKNLGGGNYFDELLARIRDIQSSEKVFWRKVLEIYATSIDYDPNMP